MKTEYNSKLIYVIAVVAATGGLLFGFDTGVISGAIPFFQKDFGIDNGMIEIITASGLCGAILGALFCGKVTDTLGRRKVILASAVVFAIGALWSGFAPDVYHLIASRLFLGVAIGVSSFAVPLYIAEISPAKKRGALVSMFQLMVTIGVLVSYLSDLFFADESRIDCWAADVLCRRDSRYRIICGYAVYARDAALVNRSRERAGRTGRTFAYRESGIQKRCF